MNGKEDNWVQLSMYVSIDRITEQGANKLHVGTSLGSDWVNFKIDGRWY